LMDYDTIVALILALLQQETGRNVVGGITEAPSEGISGKYPYKAGCIFISD
jgi:hypothetical protein